MAKSIADIDRPILMLVTEPGPQLVDIVGAAVEGGVDIVQWRDKSASVNDLVMRLAPDLCSAFGDRSLLIANFSTPSASAVVRQFSPCIDGVHFPEGSAYGQYVVKLTKLHNAERIETERIRGHADPKLGITGESVHSVDAARRAEDAGADYVIAGTIFESKSHPGRPGASLDFLRSVCEAVSIPVIAIGGITPANAADCIRAGAAGVAVLSPIMQAEDPRAAAAAYRTQLDQLDSPYSPPPSCE